jgi:hypothetical protein
MTAPAPRTRAAAPVNSAGPDDVVAVALPLLPCAGTDADASSVGTAPEGAEGMGTEGAGRVSMMRPELSGAGGWFAPPVGLIAPVVVAVAGGAPAAPVSEAVEGGVPVTVT